MVEYDEEEPAFKAEALLEGFNWENTNFNIRRVDTCWNKCIRFA
jgi:hypothetical protein